MSLMALLTIGCTLKVLKHGFLWLLPKYKENKQENFYNIIVFTLLAFVFVSMGPTLESLIKNYLDFFSNL